MAASETRMVSQRQNLFFHILISINMFTESLENDMYNRKCWLGYGLLGSNSTWENTEVDGDDSGSVFEIIIIYLPTHHEIIGSKICYAMEM